MTGTVIEVLSNSFQMCILQMLPRSARFLSLYLKVSTARHLYCDWLPVPLIHLPWFIGKARYFVFRIGYKDDQWNHDVEVTCQHAGEYISISNSHTLTVIRFLILVIYMRIQNCTKSCGLQIKSIVPSWKSPLSSTSCPPGALLA